MKRATRVRIMLLIVFGSLIYWLSSIEEYPMPGETLPQDATQQTPQQQTNS